MKLSLLFGCSFAAPLFQGNNWDFILPYYLAKKINYQAPTLNLPNINWNPIQTDSKTFLKEDVFPAVLADKFKDTNMEAVNWYYYMKKNHPGDLTAIKNLVPIVFMQGMNNAPIPDYTPHYNKESVPYTTGAGANTVPVGYEGHSFSSFGNWGNQDGFFKGDNAGFPAN